MEYYDNKFCKVQPLINQHSTLFYLSIQHSHFFFSNIVPTNAWSHVVFTWDRAELAGRLYINGVSLRSAFADTSIEPTVDLRHSGHQVYDIGLKRDNGETSHVYLSDLRVYNRQLLDTEIKNDLILNHPLKSQII